MRVMVRAEEVSAVNLVEAVISKVGHVDFLITKNSGDRLEFMEQVGVKESAFIVKDNVVERGFARLKADIKNIQSKMK